MFAQEVSYFILRRCMLHESSDYGLEGCHFFGVGVAGERDREAMIR